MTDTRPSDSESRPSDSETPRSDAQDFQQLSSGRDPGIVREFVEFLRDNKKWWLAPIVVVLLMLAALVFLAASPAAPFIYTLF